MDLSTREDINAPIEWVYERITDTAAFEKVALRRGADVERMDALGTFASGASWKVGFRFRGRDRVVSAEVRDVDPPNGWTGHFKTGGLDGTFKVELVSMSPHRTRIIVETSLAARTLSARLILQSLRLARGNVLGRFRKRVSDFASDLEASYKSQNA